MILDAAPGIALAGEAEDGTRVGAARSMPANRTWS